ncbi:hypothetical protein AB0O76_05220 [Streptomyces sp. NPDC086554]
MQYRLVDGSTERPDAPTTVQRTDDGRLVLRGDQPYCDLSGACKA